MIPNSFAHFARTLGLRRDSWRPDYGSVMQWGDDPQSRESVSVTLEPDPWEPRLSPYSAAEAWAALRPLRVVDGVRQLHLRLFADHGGGFHYLGLGSAAVGVLGLNPPERLPMYAALQPPPRVQRWLLLGEAFKDQLPADLHFEDLPTPFDRLEVSTHGDSMQPNAPVDALQRAMRLSEQALIHDLEQDSPQGLLLVDGPLQKYSDPGQGRVVGLVKTLHTRYLPEPEHQLLYRLAPGARSPLFLIGEKQVSWYLRLAPLQTLDHPLSGLVRLELLSNQPRQQLSSLQTLADQLSVVLPTLVLSRLQDPRAPQNLSPIQTLEQQLRHALGDANLLQRRLETYLTEIYR